MSAEQPGSKSWGAEPAIRTLAVIGAAALLIGMAIVGFFAFLMLRTPDYPAKVQAAGKGDIFSVGDVASLRGTSLVRISVSAGRDRGSYGYSADNTRNIVLLDTRTGANRRLLPDNSRRIEQSCMLSDEPGAADRFGIETRSENSKRPVLWYLLAVEQADGSQDLVAGHLNEQAQATILRGIDGIDSVWVRDQTHVALVLREQRRLSMRVIDMAALRQTSSTPIEID